VPAGDEQYDTGQEEDDGAPESGARGAARHEPVSGPQLTRRRADRLHRRLKTVSLIRSAQTCE